MVKCESIIGAAHAMQQTLTSETKPGDEGAVKPARVTKEIEKTKKW